MKFFHSSLRPMTMVMIAVSVLGIGSACNKDDNKPSRTELISRKWIQVDLIASAPGFPDQSVFDDNLEPCEQDNIFEFKSDGTLTVTEGASKCNVDDPDTVTSGTWQLTDNETKIIIDLVDDDPQTFTIEELTSTSVKISLVDNSTGIDIKLTGIFQAL